MYSNCIICIMSWKNDSRGKSHRAVRTTYRVGPTPTFLGVKLDHMLTFHDHLKNVAAKTKTRLNLVQKLASTSWAASAPAR